MLRLSCCLLSVAEDVVTVVDKGAVVLGTGTCDTGVCVGGGCDAGTVCAVEVCGSVGNVSGGSNGSFGSRNKLGSSMPPISMIL
jgi:hypothetical protein